MTQPTPEIYHHELEYMDQPQDPVKGQKPRWGYKKHFCTVAGCIWRPQGWCNKRAMEAHVRNKHPEPLPEESPESSFSEESEDETSSEELENEVSSEDEAALEDKLPLDDLDDKIASTQAPETSDQPMPDRQVSEKGSKKTKNPESIKEPGASINHEKVKPHEEPNERTVQSPEPSIEKTEKTEPAHLSQMMESRCEREGHVHTWPMSGDLRIESCERVCQFCGPFASAFSKATVLRDHVNKKHVAAGKYPGLKVLFPDA